MTEIVMALQAATRLTLIGVDFAAAHRFDLLTPDIDDYLNGRRQYGAPDYYAPRRRMSPGAASSS